MMKHNHEKGLPPQNQITQGVIWKQLLLFFFPILFGTFFQQLYNTADAIIVGRFVGKEGLAAVGGSAAMIINLLVGFFIGLSSGATVIISQFYGARQKARVSQAVHTAVAFSITGGLVVMAVGLICAPASLKAMGTPAETFDDSLLYLRIYFLGLIGNLLYNVGSGILRAIGDSRRPLYFLIVSCLTNILLDMVFVLGFHMGVAGVAWATIISQMISAVMVMITLMRTDDMYRLSLKDIRLNPEMLMRIIQIGLPAGLQSVMYAASNIIIQASVNSLGTDVVAAWTAFGKIDVIYWTIINAFGISITTFVGQNFGAAKFDRVRRGIKVCLGISTGVTVFLSILLFHFGQYIYLLFTTDAAVMDKGVEILRFLVPTFITYVCIEILSGALRGVGDCWIPMIMTALGVCLLRVLWIFIAVPFYPDIKTICFSYPLTWTITSIMFLIYFRWFSKIRKFRKELP